MQIYESPFIFEFPDGIVCLRHDALDNGDGNNVWPGIDIRVEIPGRHLWIEVKSWNIPDLQDETLKTRISKDFQSKLATKKMEKFRDDIFGKFLGTTSFLSWSGIGIPENVTYIILLQPPTRSGSALLGPFQTRLREHFKNAVSTKWGRRIKYQVMDVDAFRKAFPDYLITNQK